MGFRSHGIERSELVDGDHIGTWRGGFIYSHHGIYIGEGRVVHFRGETGGSSAGWMASISSSSSSVSSISSSSSSANRPLSCGRTYAWADAWAAGGYNSLPPSWPPPMRNPDSTPTYRVLYCGFRRPGNGVLLSCLDCFLLGDSLYRFEYEVPPYQIPPEEVIYRAMYLLLHGYFGAYNLITNNCEHFALYCKTGRQCDSEQVVAVRKGISTFCCVM